LKTTINYSLVIKILNSALKSSAFCDIMPCSPLKFSRYFVISCRLHLQGWRMNQAICYLFHANFFMAYSSKVKTEIMFLRNIGWLSSDYTILHSRVRTLHNHCSENFKSLFTFKYWPLRMISCKFTNYLNCIGLPNE
jgi:hypothetical protein